MAKKQESNGVDREKMRVYKESNNASLIAIMEEMQ
jgi:hypothetical protein